MVIQLLTSICEFNLKIEIKKCNSTDESIREFYFRNPVENNLYPRKLVNNLF